MASIKGQNSVKSFQKMIDNNPKLDLVSVEVHTNFGQILSTRSLSLSLSLSHIHTLSDFEL